MYSWTDADVAALADAAASLSIPPSWLAAMLSLEAGLSPGAHSSGNPHYGLNQLAGSWLQARGIDPSSYLGWSAAEQLPVVRDYLRAQASIGPLSTPGRVELAQLAPALLSNPDPNLTVYASPSAAYQGNEWLDFSGKGSITLGDLERAMAAQASKPAVVMLAMRAGQIAPPVSSPLSPRVSTGLVDVALLAGAGAAVWFAAPAIARAVGV